MTQCTSSGPKGRCKNTATKLYKNMRVYGPGKTRYIWLARCDTHPLGSAIAMRPIEEIKNDNS